MDITSLFAGVMFADSIIKYCFMLILANLHVGHYISIITGIFYFTLYIDKSKHFYNQLHLYLQQNNHKIIYKNNGVLATINRHSVNGKEVPVYGEIRNNYILGSGYSVLWFERNLYIIYIGEKNSTITSLWGGEKSVIRFVKHIDNLYTEDLVDNPRLMSHNSLGDFIRHVTIQKLDKNRLNMKTGFLEEIFRDVGDFRKNIGWYHNNSLPHKRGYLFHGEPGCGKTSLVYAIASHFNMSIKKVDLSKLYSKTDLDVIFEDPKNFIYLFEDIDVYFHDRGTSNGNNIISKNRLFDIADLFYVMDGNVLYNNTIIIFTTNYKDRLDPALIRPGRLDRHYEFEAASYSEVSRYFNKIYKTSKNKKPINDKDIKKIMGDRKISMAYIQELFISNKDDCAGFLDGLERLISN